MGPWDMALAFGMGVVAFFAAKVTALVLLHRPIPRQHELRREAILDELRHNLALRAELADSDQRLVEAWESAPDEQARWIVDSREKLGNVAPKLIELAKRYGFRAPEPSQEAPAVPAAPELAPPEQPATAPDLGAAWVGPVRMATNDDEAPN